MEIRLEQFLEQDLIDRPCYNVCINNNISNWSELLAYFDVHQSFLGLLGCGRKKDQELQALVLKYDDRKLEETFSQTAVQEDDGLKQKILDASELQHQIIQQFIEISLSNSIPKIEKGLRSYLNGDVTIIALLDSFRKNDRVQIEKIPYVGGANFNTLQSTITSIFQFSEKIVALNDDADLDSIYSNVYLQQLFLDIEFPTEVVESNSILRYIDFLIKQNRLFPPSAEGMSCDMFHIFNDYPVPERESLAERMDVSTQRITQIRNETSSYLFDALKIFNRLSDKRFNEYQIDFSADVFWVNQEQAQLINKLNGTNFTPNFISFFFNSYFRSDYELIGSATQVLLPQTIQFRSKYYWRNFYSVRKEISSCFNFDDFSHQLDIKLKHRRENDLNLDFREFVRQFSASTDEDCIARTVEVCKWILSHEFGQTLDESYVLVIPRNTKLKIEDYIIEALRHLNQPARVDPIYEYLQAKYPEQDISASSIIAATKSEQIITFGKSGTYGLREWESTREDIKGGTIRTIIQEYLSGQEDAVPIMEILAHVVQFRPRTTPRSILSNLSQEENKLFVQFSQGVVGLSERIYDSPITKLPSKLGFTIKDIIKSQPDITLEDLTQFCSEEYEVPVDKMRYILQKLAFDEVFTILPDGSLSASGGAEPRKSKRSPKSFEKPTEQSVMDQPAPDSITIEDEIGDYSPGFIMQVVFEAIRERKTLVELADEFDVTPAQIKKWKFLLVLNAPKVFSLKQRLNPVN